MILDLCCIPFLKFKNSFAVLLMLRSSGCNRTVQFAGMITTLMFLESRSFRISSVHCPLKLSNLSCHPSLLFPPFLLPLPPYSTTILKLTPAPKVQDREKGSRNWYHVCHTLLQQKISRCVTVGTNC